MVVVGENAGVAGICLLEREGGGDGVGVDRESRGQGRQKEKSAVHFNGMQGCGCVTKVLEWRRVVEYVKSAAIRLDG